MSSSEIVKLKRGQINEYEMYESISRAFNKVVIDGEPAFNVKCLLNDEKWVVIVDVISSSLIIGSLLSSISERQAFDLCEDSKANYNSCADLRMCYEIMTKFINMSDRLEKPTFRNMFNAPAVSCHACTAVVTIQPVEDHLEFAGELSLAN